MRFRTDSTFLNNNSLNYIKFVLIQELNYTDLTKAVNSTNKKLKALKNIKIYCII